jgi:hypothetical protein
VVQTVVVDEAGNYKASSLAPGKYTVTLELPQSYKISYSRKDVILDDRGTEVANFEIEADGHVSGRVVDKRGFPYDSAYLRLENTANWSSGFLKSPDGTFDLDGVVPGKYLLSIETRDRDGKEGKYWYPGTFDRAKAAPINVGLGETVEGLNFVLPEKLRIVRIEGQVFGPDGKPAKDVEVTLGCPRKGPRESSLFGYWLPRVITGEDGAFRLAAFAGTTYTLSARFRNGIPAEDRYAVPIEITPVDGEGLSGVKFVLSYKGQGAVDCK